MLKRIPLGGTLNVRDLGGYPTRDGGETAWHRHYRSALPKQLTAADYDYVRDVMDLTTVIDLRTAEEVQRLPDAFAGVDGFDYHHIPLFNDYSVEQFGAESYLLIAAHAPTMSQVFRTIANAKGAALFHCTAGKDRTGVTAALLLLLAGVEDMDIVADYQVTRTYIDELIAAEIAAHPDLPEHVSDSPVRHMKGFLAGFHERWSSPVEYMRYIGMTDDEIAKLRARLVG